MTYQRGELDDRHMSIGDHLEELRRRLIFSLAGITLAATLMLIIGQWLVEMLCMPLLQIQQLRHLPPQVYNFAPGTAFSIYMKVSLLAGVVISLPWVLYQAWRFVAVGLYPGERRIVYLLAPFSSAMVLLGAVFLYTIMLPMVLWFLITFASSYAPVSHVQPNWLINLLDKAQGTEEPPPPAPATTDHTAGPMSIAVLPADPPNPAQGQVWIDQSSRQLRIYLDGHVAQVDLGLGYHSLMQPMIEINEYFNMVIMLALGVIVAFQTPVVLTIVGWSGLVNPSWFTRYRGHCVFVCFTLGMLLTPADVFSMVLLAVPLWMLFELGVLLARVAYRHRLIGGEDQI